MGEEHIDKYGFMLNPKEWERYERQKKEYETVLNKRLHRWKAKKYLKDITHLSPSDTKLLRFVRKGIPQDYRGEAWLSGSGCRERMKNNPGLYLRLIMADERNPTSITEQIDKDLKRTFPTHKQFCEGAPRQKERLAQLRRILCAHALHNVSVGYCQGMNYIAALLLLITDNEERAFWLLVVTTDTLMPDYFSPSMESVNTDLAVLKNLADLQLPKVVAHIERHGLTLHMLVSPWFLCLYIGYCPTETVLRILDVFFFEGAVSIFQITLGMLSLQKDDLLKEDQHDNIFRVFKEMPSTLWNCNELFHHSYQDLKLVTTKQLKEQRIKEHRLKTKAQAVALGHLNLHFG